MGELVGSLREHGRGALCRAGATGQHVCALANGGKRRRGRFGAARHRVGCAFELPDDRAELDLEQFEDFLGGIIFGGSRGCDRFCSWFYNRRGRFLRTLSKQTERHEASLEVVRRLSSWHCTVKS